MGMKDADSGGRTGGLPRPPAVLVVKHSLNRYNLPVPVDDSVARLKYYVGYLAPSIAEALAKEGIDFEPVRLGKMWREILAHEYDLVVVSLDHYLEFKGTFLVCKLAGVPVAFLSDRWNWLKRASRYGPKTRLLKWLSTLFLDWGDCYFATGSKQRDYFVGRGANPEKIHLFYEPRCTRMPEVRARLTAAEVRKRLGLEGKVVFLYTGRILKDRKNLGQVIDACAALQKEGRKAAAMLVGYGRDRAALMAECAAKGVKDIHFVDYLDYMDNDLKAYYEAADAFVFVGKGEPMGFSLVEACAFGLPVITTSDVGAAYDYARDQGNGFVLKPDDFGELVEAMRKLADSKELRKRMGLASRELVRGIEARLPSFEEALVAAVAAAREERGGGWRKKA